MRRRGLAAALAVALPTAGALLSIAMNEAALRDATEWRIPITGYDPRDPLRGRYIAFRYDWRFAGGRTECRAGDCVLCLLEGGRSVRVEPMGTACPARVDARASGLNIAPSLVEEQPRVMSSTRLWVSESRAPILERQLRERRMVAVARLTRGGRLVALRLEPAP